MPLLRTLTPGTPFRLSGMPQVQGVVVRTGDCSVVVRLAAPQTEVEFVDGHGQPRRFRARRTRLTQWAPATLVEPLAVSEFTVSEFAVIEEEKSMANSKTIRKSSAGKSTTRLSAFEAAAKVLQEAGEPLSCPQIVERMLTQKLWSTKGQTPAATIYAVLLREIQTKGKSSRFARTGPGQFAIVTPKKG